MSSRVDTTAELSEKVLGKLRREFQLVASEVWVDDGRRVDFIAYGLGTGYINASVERGKFCFVEVKSCMDDFRSGHGLTFEGDENWMVCPRDLADTLFAKREMPENCKVICPDAGGRLRVAYDMSDKLRSFRKLSAAALLFQMVTDSAQAWRTSREAFYSEGNFDFYSKEGSDDESDDKPADGGQDRRGD